jgi:hypothetical protein
VVRCFEHADVIHVANKVDPIADIETIDTELALADLDIRLDGDSWNVRVGGGVRIVGEGVFRLPD